MTHTRLSVDAMCTFSWSFEEDLTLWTSLGVKSAGLLISKIDDDPRRKMRDLTDAGICASTLIVPAFELRQPDSWGHTRAVHRDAIELMAEFGGHSIYFTPGRTAGVSWRDDLARLARAAAPTVDYAAANGVLAAIEPTLRTSASFVNTLRDAIDVAEVTGLALVPDFGNIWMERDISELLARAIPHAALIQITDFMIESACRAHIGHGELPLRRMMMDVLEAGYTGLFDLEVIGPEFSAPVDETGLRRGIEQASAFLGELGI